MSIGNSLRAFAPALLWALAIWMIGGIASVPSTPDVVGLDKVAHFGMFGLLGWLFGRGWLNAGGTSLRGWPIVFVLVLGAADEVRQASVPGRSGEVADWVADAAGGTTGFFLALRRNRRPRHEQHE